MSRELKPIEPEVERWSVTDIEVMAEKVARSKLFGMDPAQAFSLMLLCQAEGLHPAKAVQRYHIIQGRPAMKADAMLADFLRIGGTVKWLTESDDREKCEAVFTHPRFAPEGKTIRYGINDAKAAGLLGNPTWQKYPSNMLRARVVSFGIRMIAPGIIAGIYTPEEIQDLDPPEEVTATMVTSKIMEPLKNAVKREIQEHHAANFDNQTGHGSGAYAAPEVVREFQAWTTSFCEAVNSYWLDFLTDKKTGEICGKAPGELITSWQLAGHLLKFAKSKGWVNAPDQIRAGQRNKFAAIAYEHHKEEIQEEAQQYCRSLWKIAKEKYKPEGRDPGSDDEIPDDDISEDEALDRVAEGIIE